MNKPLKRVVVTGLGALTPLGNSVSAYWEGLLNGVSGADSITLFDASKFKTQFACELKGFNPEDYFDRKEARKLDRFSQLAVVAASQAVEHAKLNDETINKDRVGVIWGSGIGGMTTFMEEVRNFYLGDGTPRFNPFFIPKLILDIASGHISMKYGFRGPNFATVSACASSTNAIIDAYNYIRLGKADAIICGGSEAVINEAGVGGFNAMKALSERNDAPKTASRPFDVDRDGFVMGEGAGVVVLEEYEHAKARGAKIYAEVVGYGLSGDAYHVTAPHPEGDGAFRSMQMALKKAGMTPADIDYINAHGTSTMADTIELGAVKRLFGDAMSHVSMSSTKSAIGHLLGGAGAVESIFCILALRDQIVPPTLNLDNPDDGTEGVDLVPHVAKKREVKAALNNSFGFGGTNASLIMKAI
jgi:3-oxoacyl-[acyl-carrier-protein] synthase II